MRDQRIGVKPNSLKVLFIFEPVLIFKYVAHSLQTLYPYVDELSRHHKHHIFSR